MQYSIVKIDDSYIIRVGDQDFLKVNSRRKAAKLISELQQSAGASEPGITDDGEDLQDEADDVRHPAICFQRED